MTHVGTLPNGASGFDCNATLTRATAASFAAHGYRFAVRYVRRQQTHPFDLTTGEVLAILAGGLGLMVVQHVAPPGWTPAPSTGVLYGATAARESQAIGIPNGVTVWCDLEGVAGHVAHAEVIGFCNAWYDEVQRAGYVPGLYVGDSCGLTATELYRALKFARYWAAYNLNRDQYPIVRGVQMQQRAANHPLDRVPGVAFEIDVDVITSDALGGTPSLLLP